MKSVSQRYLSAHIRCITVGNSQDMETTQVSVDGWIDKDVVCIFAMECDSALQEDVLPLWTTGMNLENIARSEISQHRPTYMWNPKKSDMEAESGRTGTRGGGRWGNAGRRAQSGSYVGGVSLEVEGRQRGD